MITVYGIRQCDTCRKALQWLAGRDIEHRFHDLRTDGLNRDLAASWLQSDFGSVLVNRRSTTWRQLDEARRRASGDALCDLLLQHPTLIKRPVFSNGAEVIAVGFDDKARLALARDD
jgi:arsenate reductase